MTAISTGALSASPLGAGAIIGAMVVAAAFLAGFAVYRRSAGAVCALLMVIAAGVLEFSVLGVLVVPSSPVLVLLEGLFGAAALVFLSSVIRPARHNALLGGVMFAAALSLVGLGVMNLLAPGDAGRLMRFGVVGVGVFAVILAGVQAPRDPGARLILPGAVIALAAPLIGHFLSGSGVAIVPHILFTLGVVAASLVALTEAPAARRATSVLSHDLAADGFSGSHGAPRAEVQPEQSLLLSENQLAQVLDYNGVAVWDWSPAASHQTDSLAGLVGAGNRATLSPQTMRNFLHGDDAAQFDSRVLGAGEPRDAAFDCTLRVNDGRALRMRGARAVNEAGAIERLVAFIENAPQEQKTAKTGAPAPKDPLVAAFADALAKGEIGLAFQPIVALDGAKVVGFEALARWRDADGAEKTGAENLVRAAESAGQGGALAMLALNAAASHLAAEMKV
ncbi:MAG TPA: EAL domain-containing protein, partial [Parvularculaceae bacterium]|nr:EAL domain-containing protein [Parvularculaceae bacterium]